MHETHEGVQDMACDTFIKIANKCKRHFVALQPGETEPFIEEIVRNMRKITCDLTPQQVHTFYEACGYMISAQGQKSLQDRLIENLMSLPNQAWDSIIQQANANPAILQDSDTIKVVGNIMKTNVAACSSIGSYFYSQIGRIYNDMLNMYRASSQLISDAVAKDGKLNSCGSMEGTDPRRKHCNQDSQSSRPPNNQERDIEVGGYLCRESR
jgi:exportin-1